MKQYYENGNLKSEILHEDETGTKIVKEYDEDENLRSEIPFKNDRVEGITQMEISGKKFLIKVEKERYYSANGTN